MPRGSGGPGADASLRPGLLERCEQPTHTRSPPCSGGRKRETETMSGFSWNILTPCRFPCGMNLEGPASVKESPSPKSCESWQDPGLRATWFPLGPQTMEGVTLFIVSSQRNEQRLQAWRLRPMPPSPRPASFKGCRRFLHGLSATLLTAERSSATKKGPDLGEQQPGFQNGQRHRPACRGRSPGHSSPQHAVAPLDTHAGRLALPTPHHTLQVGALNPFYRF